MLLPVPLPAVVLAKVLAHWAVTGLPLMMLSPLVALLLGMDVYGDGRPAARRRPAGHSGAAAECPGADFRHRGDGRGIDAFTR